MDSPEKGEIEDDEGDKDTGGKERRIPERQAEGNGAGRSKDFL